VNEERAVSAFKAWPPPPSRWLRRWRARNAGDRLAPRGDDIEVNALPFHAELRPIWGSSMSLPAPTVSARRLNGFRRIFSRLDKLDFVFIASIYFALIAEGRR
jgi:hypothetical protein